MNFTPTTPRSAAAIATALTVIVFGAFAVIAAVNPEHFDHLARKDAMGSTGLIEHLTVLVLLPGICAAIYSLIYLRRLLPSKWAQLWLLLWTLACIYFAGEECSWGQWYLDFETPEAIAETNQQDEFNLHNMSSWLNQKPRAVVEAFIIIAGLLIPLALHRREPKPQQPKTDLITTHLPWILAPAMCWATAAFFFFQRVASRIDQPWLQQMGTSEFRELGVAWFLTLYLISYWLRLEMLRERNARS